MRANEFINEGLWDTAKNWAAKKGFLGSVQQRAAMAKQIGAEEDAERIAKNEQLLSNTLLKAEQGGMIKAGASTTGKEIPDFLQIWVKNLLKNYQVSQEQQNQLNTLYNSFAQNYRGGGKLPPQGNQIFSAIETIKDMQDDAAATPAQPSPAQSKATTATSQAAPAQATSQAAPAQATSQAAPAGATAFGQMAQQLGQQNKPSPTRTGGKVAGQLSQTPNAIRKREKRAATSAGSTAGSKAFGQMAQQLGQQTTTNTNQSPGAQAFGQMAQQLGQPQTKKVASKKIKANPNTSAFGNMASQLGA